MRTLAPILLLLLLAGCGGGGQPSAVAPPTGPPTQPPPPPGPVQAPVVIAVNPGANLSGINVNVVAPASGPAPNIESLGVTPIGQGGTATNTGARISRGSNMRVILFGPGLPADSEVTIGGPGEIAISNVRTIESTTGRPGLAFEVSVPSNAALGARSVIVRAPNDNISVFAGGLEVVP